MFGGAQINLGDSSVNFAFRKKTNCLLSKTLLFRAGPRNRQMLGALPITRDAQMSFLFFFFFFYQYHFNTIHSSIFYHLSGPGSRGRRSKQRRPDLYRGVPGPAEGHSPSSLSQQNPLYTIHLKIYIF